MACRSSVSHTTQTLNTDRPSGTSYEMIWAAERMVPSTLYLLFELQPATRMPSTSSDVMASKKKTAEEMDAPVHAGVSGNTEKPTNTAVKMTMGATRNRNLSAPAGMMSSF